MDIIKSLFWASALLSFSLSISLRVAFNVVLLLIPSNRENWAKYHHPQKFLSQSQRLVATYYHQSRPDPVPVTLRQNYPDWNRTIDVVGVKIMLSDGRGMLADVVVTDGDDDDRIQTTWKIRRLLLFCLPFPTSIRFHHPQLKFHTAHLFAGHTHSFLPSSLETLFIGQRVSMSQLYSTQCIR